MVERKSFNDNPKYEIQEERRWKRRGFRFAIDIFKGDFDLNRDDYIDEERAYLVRKLPDTVYGGPMDGAFLAEYVLVDGYRFSVEHYRRGDDVIFWQEERKHLNKGRRDGNVVIDTDDPDRKIILWKRYLYPNALNNWGAQETHQRDYRFEPGQEIILLIDPGTQINEENNG